MDIYITGMIWLDWAIRSSQDWFFRLSIKNATLDVASETPLPGLSGPCVQRRRMKPIKVGTRQFMALFPEAVKSLIRERISLEDAPILLR